MVIRRSETGMPLERHSSSADFLVIPDRIEECQRLSIARALLKDAPVILLDEATASLDVDSETQIQEAISELVSGKTVLVIAHRMRTIEAADQIVVLDKGVVAEKGNHDTLMKKKGLYRKLVDLQTEAANWKLSV